MGKNKPRPDPEIDRRPPAARSASKRRQDRLDVLRLWAQGMNRVDIAEELGLSYDSVRNHMEALERMGKIDAADFDQIFRESYQRLRVYEDLSVARGSLRNAMDARRDIVKLLGIAKPQKMDITTDGRAITPITIEVVQAAADTAGIPPAVVEGAFKELQAAELEEASDG